MTYRIVFVSKLCWCQPQHSWRIHQFHTAWQNNWRAYSWSNLVSCWELWSNDFLYCWPRVWWCCKHEQQPRCTRQSAPLATYFHCDGHCLNLVIMHSCSLPNVRNVVDKMKAVRMFFRFSPVWKSVELSVHCNRVNTLQTASEWGP